MRTSGNDCITFESLTLPHSWLIVSDELNECAERLFSDKDKRITVYIEGSDVTRTDPMDRGIFLLAGFSLENLIKAYLIYENPAWISDGKLSRNITQRHSLTEMSEKSRKLPWPKKGRRILQAFEDGLSSWARYPSAVNVERTSPQRFIHGDLWTEYRTLRKRYVEGLETLLRKRWQGPHEFEGYYEISD